MRLVLDASVCLKWFLWQHAPEADFEIALDLLQRIGNQRVNLVQPPVWHCEIAAVLARMLPNHACRFVDALQQVRATVDTSAQTLQRATQLSMDLNHHVFDTIYHAVAIENTAILVTADRHYYRKAHALGHIALLRDWQADGVAESRAGYTARPDKHKAVSKAGKSGNVSGTMKRPTKTTSIVRQERKGRRKGAKAGTSE